MVYLRAADAYTLLARYHDYYSFTSMPEVSKDRSF